MESLTSSVGETCDADGRWQQCDEMIEVVKDAAAVHSFWISETGQLDKLKRHPVLRETPGRAATQNHLRGLVHALSSQKVIDDSIEIVPPPHPQLSGLALLVLDCNGVGAAGPHAGPVALK